MSFPLNVKMSSFTSSSSTSLSSTGDGHQREFGLNAIEVAGNNTVQEMKEIMQQIQQLQQGLLEINAPYLARMPKSQMGIKGKNDARMNRKNNLSATDAWNARVISNYIRETIWPTYKILPKLWSRWMVDERSLSYQVMQKITLPPGTDGKEYWENMLVGIANDKFCALRSNLKQGLFVQYESN